MLACVCWYACHSVFLEIGAGVDTCVLVCMHRVFLEIREGSRGRQLHLPPAFEVGSLLLDAVHVRLLHTPGEDSWASGSSHTSASHLGALGW